MSRRKTFQVELKGALEGKTAIKSARGVVESLLRTKFRQRETVKAADLLKAGAEMTGRKFPFQKYWVDGKAPVLARTDERGTYRNPFFTAHTKGATPATGTPVVTADAEEVKREG